ncbi:hypothetical protein BDV12DRAFT_49978 [Aspergillus spectabilis]
MKKGTKGRPRKRDHWTLPEWKTFSPWMTEHERRGTPWAMREKLWEEKHNKYRSCQALRAAWNRWKLGWRPKILENSEEICSSISRAPADAAPEEQHKPFNTQADSSALPIGSATPTQDETPQMSRFQRRNKRRMLTRRLTYRLFRTLKFCKAPSLSAVLRHRTHMI